MILKNYFKSFCLLLGLLGFVFTKLYAGSESYVHSLSGKIKKGDSIVVIDDKFQNLPLDFWNKVKNRSVDDIVSFEIRLDTMTNFLNKPFSCTLNITIRYYKTRDQQTADSISNINLIVKYDTAKGKNFPMLAQYKFKDAYKVVVVVNSITSNEFNKTIPPIFRLKSQIMVDRKYPFDPTALPTLHLGLLQWMPMEEPLAMNGPSVLAEPMTTKPQAGLQIMNGQLPISWNTTINGTVYDEFDIEWSYFDAQSAIGYAINPAGGVFSGTINVPTATIEGWMRNNSTRVTVTSPPYNINLPYTDGFVFVRIRGVSYDPTTNVRLTTFPWQYTQTDGTIAGVYVTAHQPNLNWQYTASFAEEGKRKEVISYFDGSLRSRQSVTINNSDLTVKTDGTTSPTAIVQETIYDMMGRPAVNILPAPVKNDKLDYYPGFNQNKSGSPYSYSDIGLDASSITACSITADYLNTSSGASQYYSSNNSFLDAVNSVNYYFTKYVPDAQAYPFSTTQYTPDNTGRIKKQGGVGQNFQIGSGHETQYYYGKPFQKDLDRLFGMEVGNASHYLKNMVVDPNGQVSVSYVDANGKTIATALAGNPPPNVDGLPSSQSATANSPFNETLISSNDLVPNTQALNSAATATFLAPVSGNYSINYSISPLALINTYSNGTGKICSNCFYNIQVSVFDDCNNLLGSYKGTPFQGNDVTCYSAPQVFTGSIPLSIQKIGEYTVSYSMQLSNDVINFQTDNYVNTNTDLLTLQSYFLQQLNALNLGGCYNSCSACKMLGTSPTDPNLAINFQQSVMNLIGKDPEFAGINPNDPAIATWITNTWNSLNTACKALSCAPPSPCQTKLSEMENDVIPGGQYAQYSIDPVTGAYSLVQQPINVLQYYNSSNPTNNPNITAIQNLTVTNPDGSTTPINQLSLADFINAYIQHPEWASTFVTMHVEYCSYNFCTTGTNEASYIFDQQIQNSYPNGTDAINAGLYNRSDAHATLNLDPFFNGGSGAIYKTAMQGDLDNTSAVLLINIPDANGNILAPKNILQLVDWTLYCKPAGNGPSQTDLINSWQNCSPNNTCRSDAQEWVLYSSYYEQLKSKYVELVKQAAGCINCYVGNDGLAGSVNCATAVASQCPAASEFAFTQTILNTNTNTATGCSSTNFLETIQHIGGPITSTIQIKVMATFNSTTFGGEQSNIPFYYTSQVELVVTMYPGSTIANVDNNSYSKILSSLGRFSGCANSSWTYAIESGGIICSPSSTCSSGNLSNDTLYSTKSRIWDQYINYAGYLNCFSNNTSSSLTTQQQQSLTSAQTTALNTLNAMANTSNPGQEGSWYSTLAGVVQEEDNLDRQNGVTPRFQAIENSNTLVQGPTSSGYQYTQLVSLVKKLYNVSLANINYYVNRASTDIQNYAASQASGNPQTSFLDQLSVDMSNIRATSTLVPPTVSSDGFASFKDVFTSVIGTTMMQAGFGPDLLSSPYPTDKNPVGIDATVSQITPTICANVANLQAGYTASGSTLSFHDYLANLLGSEFVLSNADLNDLQSRCANGCSYLANSLLLPIAFTQANASTTCANISSLQTAFNAAYPNVAPDTKLYRNLFANYINLQLGYTLSYEDYANYINNQCPLSSNTAALFNKPASMPVLIDPFICPANLIRTAYENAGQQYTAYIAQIRQDFRNKYIATCLSNAASVNVQGNLQEYHYTLYYYDQSGNLVKTIPPEGVQLLTDDQINQVEIQKNPNLNACVGSAGGASIDANLVLTNLSTYLQNNTAQSLELWLYSGTPTNTPQFRAITPDNKFMIQAAIANNKCWLEIYSLSPGTMGDISMTLSNQAVADASSLPPLQSWMHLVAQSPNGLVGGSLQLYVDGVKLPILNATTAPPYPYPWEIDAGFTLPTVDISLFKQLRVYNRPITDAEVTADYNNICLGPVGDLASMVNTTAPDNTPGPRLLWGRFNLILPGNPSVFDWAYQFIVPNHGMSTNYAYNSLNQVVQQVTPDAGLSTFLYDKLGRLSISQNAEQLNSSTGDVSNRYSYTRYDALGRIYEVGEKIGAPVPQETDAFNTISDPLNPGQNISLMENWLRTNSGGSSPPTSTAYNRQVTVTAYDAQPSWAPATVLLSNLRKRVAATTILSNGSDPSQNRVAASYYSYDYDGNVKELVQENTDQIAMEKINVPGTDGLKRIDYQYDLISGKVNKVLYQDGKWDQFYYQYLYDADNRVIQALSSRNNYSDPGLWITEAAYRYYLHGPLARMQLGNSTNNNQVQGIDYAYTLQGWLKGVNGQFLPGTGNSPTDMSGDGFSNSQFSYFARDAFGFSLGYYTNDYAPIGGSTANAFGLQYNVSNGSGVNLYNGNISHATYAIAPLENGNTVGYTYRYDQLNRITTMDRHNIVTGSSSWDNSSIISDYAERISYDANGNIKTYNRNGPTPVAGGSNAMDQLSYQYNYDANNRLLNNKLQYIQDAVPSTGGPDIQNQAAGNYSYDNIGNLIADASAGISGINWTVYGKISSITRSLSSVNYVYDASGNRVGKYTFSTNGASGFQVPQTHTTNTWYVRDAQGNVLGVYYYENPHIAPPTNTGGNGYQWLEQHLYGSSRLGMVTPDFWMPGAGANDAYNPATDLVNNAGNRNYDLENHLGNVLATINDIKTNGSNSFYSPTILSAQDYYPFGMLMPGRQYGAIGRYGFNGKEQDPSINGTGVDYDYGARIYDARTGKFLSADPLISKYPELTPYQFASNTPVQAIDLDGKEGMYNLGPNATTKDYIEVNRGYNQFAKSAVKSFVNDFKSLFKVKTYENFLDFVTLMFVPDVSSHIEQNDQKRYGIVQGGINGIKNIPNWGPNELGSATGHLTFQILLGEIIKVRGGFVGENSPFKGLGNLREPAITPGLGETKLIDYSGGLASRKLSTFTNVIKGRPGEAATKYLWTIDKRGINIALEQTPAATSRGFITHTNISNAASAGGEVWFTGDKSVFINAKSARFGGSSMTSEQWNAAKAAWEKIGYKVEAQDFKPPTKQ